MSDRLVGSLLVVASGLVATGIGGPVFAVLMIALGIAAYREFLGFVGNDSGQAVADWVTGAVLVAASGLAALLTTDAAVLFAPVAAAVATPLLTRLSRAQAPGALEAWAIASSGTLYVALPVYAAIALRSLPGQSAAGWPIVVADALSLGWSAAPLGLAWTLTVLLATWLSDSTAYLVGRSLGRHRLAPRLSPGKTVEGAIAGMVVAVISAMLAFPIFGIGGVWLGATVGAAIGFAGQAGDLAESFFKRQAGVKDSGSLIPGHGGVLDRIDALLFAFPVSFVLAVAIERLGWR